MNVHQSKSDAKIAGQKKKDRLLIRNATTAICSHVYIIQL